MERRRLVTEADKLKFGEFMYFKKLITELYPTGIVSIVSDTYDFWGVMTEFMPLLKNDILARNGRVVIRPDSGDPVKIITGWSLDELNDDLTGLIENKTIEGIAVKKGAIEVLWDIFGGTINEKGYKELNPKIGLIYGDAISPVRHKQILERLETKGFSANNLVFGIGSFSYTMCTRDNYGFAMKATWGTVNGVAKDIFKDPKTDRGFKKSAKGLLCVYRDENGDLKLKDQCTREEERQSLLTTVFLNGKLVKETTMAEIRAKIDTNFI